MQKLLLFLFVLYGIWYVRRHWLRADGEAGPAQPPHEAPVETMRECRHCGLVVPESEGVQVGEAFYCSSEHAREAGRRA